MNTEKSIEGNLKELRKQYTICFIIISCIGIFHFIFLLPVVNFSLTLISFFAITYIFVAIALKASNLLLLNKWATDYYTAVKLRDLVNEKMRVLPFSTFITKHSNDIQFTNPINILF